MKQARNQRIKEPRIQRIKEPGNQVSKRQRNKETTSLHIDMHYPSHIDIGVYIGTIGLFFVFFLLFARYFPVLALNEVKTILKSSGEYHKNLPDDHDHTPNPAPKVEAVLEKEVSTEKGVVDKSSKLIERLGSGSADNKDDLKKISGVGPVLENKLNDIGIFSYEQVSKMTKEEYDMLDEMTKSC